MRILSIQTRRAMGGIARSSGVMLLGTGLLFAVYANAAAADTSNGHADKAQSGDQAKPVDKSQKTGKSQKNSQSDDSGGNKSTGNNNGGSAKKGDQSAAPDQTELSGPFSYDKLIDQAKALAKKDYQAPAKVPQFLTKLSPDQLSQISFKRDDALWHDQKLPFQVMFYHPGSYYEHAVTIHVIKDGKTTTVQFDKNDFNYPNDDLKKKVPDDLGYAGLKLLHTLGDPKKMDEVVSFLGASYFRALGADEHYGLSARGLAINTGNTQKGEEFPNFTQFWLVDPGDKSKDMTLYALLDSPSVTGAYKFVITPGQATHTHVEETLFTRKDIAKLGIAPLTSMFTWGENSLARINDYRPEAHDSDGMLISSANGEWLWRPLVNPQKLWMNQFDANNVRGFGLMQRDRNFDDYQDLNYEYEKRPNAWVTPDGDWGKGHLELVEIPSDSEVNDNISLYWVPQEPVKAGQRLHFAYDIKWSSDLAVPKSLGHAIATRVGMAAVAPGQQKNQVRVVIDFVGGELSKLTDANSVQPKVNATRDVTLNNIQAVRNPHTGGWRLSFLVPTSALDKPLELRAYLADANGGGLTETWSYLLATP
ncbi:glucan biosynthesis protein [Salinisphaera hydrothermalis]|uniref:Glucan biosynthesis protein G n=1 Tax=Salinisphaera hydrothermalis (strain C41B8) TaxID=1304275 RepID=A0A084IM91_SALHC|nr:glucan biosynthesis protein [Salinisphaera hydrothermalis]KEZ77825.1 glucan biosynthesis protein G [Salinisphaera hydrothermalis C41B8]